MRFLRMLYAGWMRFAHLLGTINRYVLLTVFYFVIVNLTNLVIRLLRIDLLDRRMRTAESHWKPKSTTSNMYHHQF